MIYKVYADVKWIAYRFTMHLSVIILIVFLASYIMQSNLFFFAVIFFLLLVYIMLIWLQFKLPLFSINSEFIEINNLFYKGKVKLPKKDIHITRKHKKIIISVGANKYLVSLSGMSDNNFEKAVIDLDKILPL